MKKEIIITIFISIAVYKLYSLYSLIIQERKKHKNKKLLVESDVDSSSNQPQIAKKDKCIDYPIHTAPNSPYVGVKDKFTFDVVYNIAILLSTIGLLYMYFN